MPTHKGQGGNLTEVKYARTFMLTSCDRAQSDECLTMIRKLSIDYVNFIKECWVHASVSF